MIVKVQLSLAPNHQHVLIYNKDQSVFWVGDASAELVRRMNGRLKCFFSAKLGRDGKLVLGNKTSDRAW